MNRNNVWGPYQGAEKVPVGRLLKNIQMQGTRQSLSASGGPRSEAHILVRRNAVDGRFSATCYLVTLIPEVISNIGNKIAMTMKPTTTPMNRITTGSMMEVSEVMVASTSSS